MKCFRTLPEICAAPGAGFPQLHPKHCIRQRFEDFGHDLYRLFLRHIDTGHYYLGWQTAHSSMAPVQSPTAQNSLDTSQFRRAPRTGPDKRQDLGSFLGRIRRSDTALELP